MTEREALELRASHTELLDEALRCLKIVKNSGHFAANYYEERIDVAIVLIERARTPEDER